MPKVAVYDITGKQTGEEIELMDYVFGVEFNEAVVHQAVVMQQANERQGTHATKTRGMVRGGGRKPWKQKGTGRARAGSVRSPLWVGGGTVFGPAPRSHAKDMPRKARRLAIRCALSAKVAEGALVVVDNLTFDAPKTKDAVAMLTGFEAADKKALIITDGENENVEKSSRNIEKVKALSNDCLNVYDILNAEKVLLAKDAVARIEEVLA
ncbi:MULTISPECIES: 50S ribosomal protein L4 [Acidaminococcus]|uniref:Large ribosomal subunit protein uL4 n=2 Tax=Acidaminococcus fermentans TaxID=905 RepID=D2RMH8_ACIFV|nr:50S ribosomal protein L4 [Acidaminococcus fermentans]ADB48280.1 ribosomal protein L4/L1e [Acidaminococcus fermentans DSM 20731]MCF0140000.1 50S ribosomal protein L4 [Acidaminococcus fermentans]MCI6285591.1 50S ribosomal protein L4 [Acidaminococcus fermentans]MCI7195283.1 50S ribosomal protein L4 [Acidaminococcus fermentans]MDD6287228.1 50S ribosomal protein L4 [Acidaminococcus fermentans]